MIASRPSRPSSTWRSTNQRAALKSRGIIAPTLPPTPRESSSRGARAGGIFQSEYDREPPFPGVPHRGRASDRRSEEHTSELQSRSDLVCRLLLEKKKYIR